MKNNEIDWAAQWEMHGQGFRDGYVPIQLKDYGGQGEVKLKPGPGFGDLSHETTRLVLTLMGPCVKGKRVLDIGCGSGVLSTAAAALGASEVYAIDIDPDAVAHTKDNAALNGLASIVHAGLPGSFSHQSGEWVILMNMIRTEQQQAWQSILDHHNAIHGTLLTSGVLIEEKGIYRAQCAAWGWKEIAIVEEGSWAGFQSQLQNS